MRCLRDFTSYSGDYSPMSFIKPFTSGGSWIAASALSLSLASSGLAAFDQPLSIHIAPSPIETAERGTELQVTLIVADHQGGPLFLGFRDHWGPVIDVSDNIHGLSVDNGSLKVPNPDELRENWRVIKVEPHTADEPFRVHYQVGLGDNPPSDADAINVRADYLHAIGTTFLPRFCLRTNNDWDCFENVSTTFDWSAFGNRAVGPNGSSDQYDGSQSGLLDAVYSAGVFDEETTEIETTARKTPIRVIAKGLGPDERRDAFDVIARALQAVHSFWNEQPPDDYIISIRRVTPPNEEGGGISGTELSNGFAVALYGNETMSSDATLSVVTHEYHHRWIGSKLVADPDTYRWFGEGFTDFLTWQSLWRSGVISFDEYLKAINETLEAYHQSPFRLLSPEQIGETGGNAYKISYSRGHLLALSWWHQLNSQSIKAGEIAANALPAFALPFDEVLRDLTKAGRRQGSLDLKQIAEIAAHAGLDDVTRDVERTVLSGEMLPTRDWFGSCADLVYRNEQPLDHGFDLALTFKNDGALTHVDPEGPAAKAGLKDGDGLSRLRYREDADGTSFVALKVKRDEATHEATFELNHSTSTQPIPQFRSNGPFTDELALDCLKADEKQ